MGQQCQEAAPDFPAQAAIIWYAAAKVLSTGLSALPPHVLPFVVAGLVYGAITAVAAVMAPDRVKKLIPSSSGVSLGLMLGPYIPGSMVLGCLIFSWLGKRWYACKEKALNDFI